MQLWATVPAAIRQLCNVLRQPATHCGSGWGGGVALAQVVLHVCPALIQVLIAPLKVSRHGWMQVFHVLRALWQAAELKSVAHASWAACCSVLQVDCAQACASLRAALRHS